ncbi:hypothetical protein [Kitasatospora sp. NPDC057500]|uniref:hypothetical protein n=1 Tax=Kitasatospora sp. NPDC057500 TaxID=3346151 RepID=UPI0036CEA356
MDETPGFNVLGAGGLTSAEPRQPVRRLLSGFDEDSLAQSHGQRCAFSCGMENRRSSKNSQHDLADRCW